MMFFTKYAGKGKEDLRGFRETWKETEKKRR
jgi:hypothetical protein